MWSWPGSRVPMGPATALVVRGESLLLDVTRLAAAAQAGIEARDELRGVLAAYQAKAQAIGLAESLELAELYAAALRRPVLGAL